MLTRNPKTRKSLRLRAGELVEVRSREEILQSLAGNATLDGLPFMPEMLKFSGKRHLVFKRVEKVCGNFENTGYIFRRMENVVLLEGVRCDGEAHAGCQAACMILWKEAWLKRVSPDQTAKSAPAILTRHGESSLPACATGCTEASLLEGARKCTGSPGVDDETFVCQLTELKCATSPLAWWDVRAYWRDLRSGNVSAWQWVRGMLIAFFNAVQGIRKGVLYPHFEPGTLKKTPSETLNLRPGDVVEVKSKDEISQTLDWLNRNRGLYFDMEMLKYCGRRFKVCGRVGKVINDRTGKILNLGTESIILEDVICNGDCHLFCPRSEFIYWREIWLRRVCVSLLPEGHCDNET